MKTLSSSPTLLSMSCYQFALYGGTDKAALKSVSDRFSAMGNFLIAAIPLAGLKHVTGLELNAVVAGHNMNNQLSAAQRLTIMQLLCKEFELKTKVNGAVATLYGLFGNQQPAQMLPEHMWITYGNDIYDTMPSAPIRTQKNVNGLNPPSEAAAVSANEIGKIGLQSLTAGQLAILGSTAWK